MIFQLEAFFCYFCVNIYNKVYLIVHIQMAIIVIQAIVAVCPKFVAWDVQFVVTLKEMFL